MTEEAFFEPTPTFSRILGGVRFQAQNISDQNIAWRLALLQAASTSDKKSMAPRVAPRPQLACMSSSSDILRTFRDKSSRFEQ